MLGRRRRARLGTHDPRGNREYAERRKSGRQRSRVGRRLADADDPRGVRGGRSHAGDPSHRRRCPRRRPRLPSADTARGRRRRGRSADVPPSRRRGVVRRRLRRLVHDDRRLLRDLRRDAPARGSARDLRRPGDDLGRELPAGQRRGGSRRRRLPGQRPLGVGERFKPRKLVHRGRHARAGRRAGHRPRWAAGHARVLLPRFRGEGDRHLGVDGASRHRKSRLRGAGRLRARAPHPLVPGASQRAWAVVPACRPSRCSPPSSPRFSSASRGTRSTRSSSSQRRRSRPCRRSSSPTGDGAGGLGPGDGARVLGARAPRERAAGPVGPSGSRTCAHTWGSRRSLARRRPRRAHRARGDRHAVHGGGRHRGVRHEPAGPLPA